MTDLHILSEQKRLIPFGWLISLLLAGIGSLEYTFGYTDYANLHAVNLLASLILLWLVYRGFISAHITVIAYLLVAANLLFYQFQFESMSRSLNFYAVIPFLLYHLLGLRLGWRYSAIFAIFVLSLCLLLFNGVMSSIHDWAQLADFFTIFIFFSACAFFIERERQQRLQQVKLERDRRKIIGQELDEQQAYAAKLKKLDAALLQSSYEQALNSALAVMLESMACSRVWLMHVRADGEMWHVPYEATVAEYPGALKAADFLPVDEAVRGLIEQEHRQPMAWDKMDEIPGDPEWVQRYHIRSQLMIMMHVPAQGHWYLGMHQCDRERSWSQADQQFLSDCAGHVQAVLSQKLLHDELEQGARQANQASDAKSTFLATMSHELRTPLHGIIGMQSLLAKRADYLNDGDQKLLSLAQHSAHILSSLIDDVLDLSKIEAGKIEIEVSEFDMAKCLQDAMFPFLMTAFEKNIELTLNMKMIPARIIGDEKRIRQVLLNLLGNAMKFTDQGKVELRVSYQREHLQMMVIDSGIGIAADQMDMIFEPFVQLSDDAGRQGTGLGTTIAQQFISIMYGHIDVSSEEGKGSTFTVTLPLAAVGQERISDNMEIRQLKIKFQGAETINDEPELANLRVLLAEDDPIARMIALENLSHHALDVDVAVHGLQAWEKFQANDYDLLLTDIRMPGLNGIELTQRIRLFEKEQIEKKQTEKEQAAQSRLCIIGISAHVLEDVAQECLAAGMDDFIAKPIDPDALMQRLHHMHITTS